WLGPVVRAGASRAKVGVMAASNARAILERLLDDLARAGRISAPRGPVVARLLPLAPLLRTYADRVLVVGDAAGLVKPTTGGGIYYSLLSAQWAAEAVGRAFDRGAFSTAPIGTYEGTWRARPRR